jgi:hypothetical protein
MIPQRYQQAHLCAGVGASETAQNGFEFNIAVPSLSSHWAFVELSKISNGMNLYQTRQDGYFVVSRLGGWRCGANTLVGGRETVATPTNVPGLRGVVIATPAGTPEDQRRVVLLNDYDTPKAFPLENLRVVGPLPPTKWAAALSECVPHTWLIRMIMGVRMSSTVRGCARA